MVNELEPPCDDGSCVDFVKFLRIMNLIVVRCVLKSKLVMRTHTLPILATALLALSACNNTPTPQNTIQNTPQNTATDKAPFPKYDHIFIIIEENHAYDQVIGKSYTPTINKLAQTYGIATNYFGVVHPSEANYVALIGGSTFGIHDDAPYNAKSNTSGNSSGVEHTITQPSLLDQLEAKGLTWKGYFEDIPSPGYKGTTYPTPTKALYASKHNGFINFKKVQDNPQELAKLVGFDQLNADLKSGNVPNYSHIVPNQCNEMHGLSVVCPLQGADSDSDRKLIQQGDAIIGKIVNQIMSSSFWSSGNNAIVVTWDEDNFRQPFNQGCCGFDPKSPANFGGGHIATIIITSHGGRGVKDNTAYNHYSLLRTVEDAFGLNYLNYAGDTANGVKSMTPFFAPTAATRVP